MIYYDTETCGLHGQPVLIQFAINDGPVDMWSFWKNPIWQSLLLIERIITDPEGVVGFNLVFDHFQLCKIYTMLSLYPDKSAIPEDVIDDLADLEMAAMDQVCLKPVKCCDVFLHARKTTYQSTMDRHDIRIRKVPTSLVFQLAGELERRISFKEIYFSRRKDKHKPKWNVYDRDDGDGNIDGDFKDIVLKFAPSSALKALAVDALNLNPNDVLKFGDVGVDDRWLPNELGYAPYAKAVGGDRRDWKGAWPEVIRHHISHWEYNELARKYASLDVEYTRQLYKFFGSPTLGDDDSELACSVAACRWRGFTIDLPKLKTLRTKAITKIKDIPTAPKQVRSYIYEKLDATEQLVLRGSTKKVLLESIAKLEKVCLKCNSSATMDFQECELQPDLVMEVGDITSTITKVVVTDSSTLDKKCPVCNGKGTVKHDGAKRAQEVLDARAAIKEIELYDKLLLAGRFHISNKIIGALSGRMSGADGLNAQGIKSTKEVRSCFTFAHPGTVLSAGDFSSFEITLAESCYNDPDLRKDLLTCEDCEGQMEFVTEKSDFICKSCGGREGKKIHALFGMSVFTHMTYDEIKATKGAEDDLYTKSKQAVFCLLYGGEGGTLADRLGVDLETANLAFERFLKKYRQVGVERKKVMSAFCSMNQLSGIGSKITWREPAEYIESMFGFRRYFTLENMICKTLYLLAENPPPDWKQIKVKVTRRDREQLASGAVRSAVFAAAFNIQSSALRAAVNHKIQSSGAQVTKRTQRAVWDIQPSGVHPWLVQPMQVHDEISVVCDPSVVDKVAMAVKDTVETFRPTVTLIKMDWHNNLKNWAEK